jgi:hypothetical protein
VSDGTTTAGYLDTIMASVRAFGQELEVSRRWLTRAGETESQAWRLSFLREARAAHERTARRLAALAERLGELGDPESIPAPLDRIHKNLDTMRAELSAHEESLARMEARELQASPLGRA